MKRKIIKFTISSFLIFIMNVGLAQQVTQSEAINAAVNIMRYDTRNDLYVNSISAVYEKNVNDNTLLYEVVFDDGHIVLLSGNKSCIPVLGMIIPDEDIYPSSILEGYDNPEALNCFIDSYSEQVRYCFDNRVNGTVEQEEWRRLLQYDTSYYNNSRVPKVGPLISTKWGQYKSNGLIYDEHAYNYYVTNTGMYCEYTYCFAGCVAVAMAQVMRYWNHPAENPSKCYQYDWNNMPEKLKKNRDNYETKRNAIARLIYDCAQSVDMDYCTANCISLADTQKVPSVLVQFGYNDAIYKDRSEYDNEQWGYMLRSSLNDNIPVIYNGRDGENGHCFICDGYKKRYFGDGYLYSFNWGENGKGDGWFFIENITTRFNGPIQYFYDQDAIFNIYPAYCWKNIIVECDKYYSNGSYKDYCIDSIFNNNGNDYVINSGASIHLSAGEDIILTDGFFAVEGADFYAGITSTNSSRGGGKNNGYNEISQNYNETVEYDKLTIPSNTFNTQLGITIYPNPTDGMFSVSFNNPDECLKQITIFNHLRSVVINKENPNDNTIDMNNLGSGLYIVKIISDKGNVYFDKVIKK